MKRLSLKKVKCYTQDDILSHTHSIEQKFSSRDKWTSNCLYKGLGFINLPSQNLYASKA
jgi:hypothetical protein